MTVMQAIEARRSIRHYTQQPVTDEELMAVLEAGRLAPSARNTQSWQFTAVRENLFWKSWRSTATDSR